MPRSQNLFEYISQDRVDNFETQLLYGAYYCARAFIDKNLEMAEELKQLLLEKLPTLAVSLENPSNIEKLSELNDLVFLSKEYEGKFLGNTYWVDDQLIEKIQKLDPYLPGEISVQTHSKHLHRPLKNRCLFLDRDGVVIKYLSYPNDPSQIELMPDIEKLVAWANKNQILVVVVSNQSGVARGLISWEQLDQVNHKMKSLLAEKGCWLDSVELAPYYRESKTVSGKLASTLRKPLPGMILNAQNRLGIDLSQSIMIGDRYSDFEAAQNAGVGTYYHLFNSEFSEEADKVEQSIGSARTCREIKLLYSMLKSI